MSDWFKYRDTVIDISWDHDPTMGGTKIFASKDVLFEARDVEIITEGEDLSCEYEASERYVRCVSDTPGLKRVVIREQ